jgi:nucleoside-diphosphate-sugar epimerase
MTRIAVLGANGQVGAELCLLLANHRHVELVPVCRNRAGSAFLRYHGLRCRHGLPADAAQAADLFGDCDVIVNAALAAGTPRQQRAGEHALISNSLRWSRPGARVIYFSTMMVHGSPRPGTWLRRRTAYGKLKRRSERVVRAEGKRHNKETYILRLGHVCGELQNISRELRRHLHGGEVVVTTPEGPSNTVYTCTIADAVLKIADGKERPGTYDLMCWPEWTWQEVYAYEAESCGLPLRVCVLARPKRGLTLTVRWLSGLARMPLTALLRLARGSESMKDAALAMLARAPTWLNERAQATWHRSRARAEIAAIHPPQEVPEAMSWRAMGKDFLANLVPTRDLLNDPAFRLPRRDPRPAWPADLPYSGCAKPD